MSRYTLLGHRITWHSDTSRSGGGAPDGTVDTNDPKVHFIYNERWQQVATYRQANGSNIDTHPKEQFVNHAAGLAGYGSSSYIDGVILRDDHEDDWTEAADSTMERRVYYCQNWRADVVAILAENGRIVEKAWYEPYGTPHGLSPADFSGTSDDTNDHYLVPDGDADADDSFVYLDLFGVSAGLSDTTGSSDPGDPEYGRPNGVIDSDDYFYFLDRAGDAAALGRNVLSAGHDGATASHGAGNLRNRKGLAGYEWDPHVRRYHVRNRVLYPEIGRWTRRDPLGYVDGMGLYGYSRLMPVVTNDSHGLATCGGRCSGAKENNLRPSDPPTLPGFPIWKPAVSGCETWAEDALRIFGLDSTDSCWQPVYEAANKCCLEAIQRGLRDPIHCVQSIQSEITRCRDARTLAVCKVESVLNPMLSSSSECDDYPASYEYMGAQASCFCKCAGDSAWSQYVRRCLKCMYDRGVAPHPSHMRCYAAATEQGLARPDDQLAMCYAVCTRHHWLPWLQAPGRWFAGPGHSNAQITGELVGMD